MLNLKLISEAMGKLQMSQATLADHCGVSREAVSNWLQGESRPRPLKLKMISQALGIDVKNLLVSNVPQPVVAYRTKNKVPATDASMAAARNLGVQLRQLVPFVQDFLFAPAHLDSPVVSDSYIRRVTQSVRSKLELSAYEPISREHLLQLHRDFGSLLVPVRWSGEKSGHENALSVYLPDSKTSWVVFSLNAKSDDFNYWLAHELGHCYSLHAISGEEGEAFAERFAQELLFPHEASVRAIDEIYSHSQPLDWAKSLAQAYNISVVTVIKQVELTAKTLNKEVPSLQTEEFWQEWKSKRETVPTVARTLFVDENLQVEKYIQLCEDFFKTPVFEAISQWQLKEEGRSPAFISSVLNIGLEEAIELSVALMNRAKRHNVGAPSLNNDR